MKVIAGVSTNMFIKNSNLVTQLITPLLNDSTLFGASVFDADQSQLTDWALPEALWGSS